MKVAVKLYAMLAGHLPAHAVDNQVSVDAPEDATVMGVLAGFGLPPAMCHLVLVNGAFIAPSERATRRLNDGDTLAVWPPVAGG